MNYKITRTLLLFIGSIFLVFFTSCNLINPSEEIPSYIRIDKIEVYSSSVLHGSVSENITDAWINIDGNLLGVYELPVTFPVLKTGKHTIMVRAGIKANGIAASRKWYPFYQSYSIDTTLVAGEVITLKPRVTYRTETKVAFNETFDQIGMFFDTLFPGEVPFIKSNENVFEGNFSGLIHMPGSKKAFRCKTSESYELPKNQSSIYLEFDYKTNIEFYMGLVVNSNSGSTLYPYFYNVRPNENWNKIYFEITDMVLQNYYGNSYNIYIGADKADTTIDGKIFFDNIKLLHF